MRCQNITECFEQIRAYAEGENTGFPLIVNVENFKDYQEIMQRLIADDTKQCIYVSEHTYVNGLPDIQSVLDIIREDGNYVVSGFSQGLMLQGEKALDTQIDNLIGYSIYGHAIVLLCQCRHFLEKYLQRDKDRLERRIVFLEGEKTSLPQLRLARSKEECEEDYSDGIRSLLSCLEKMSDYDIAKHPTQYVITSFSEPFFKNSMYAVTASKGVYDNLTKKFSDLSAGTNIKMGTEDEWAWLYKQSKKFHSFSELIVKKFGPTSNLASQIGAVFEAGDEKSKWLLWLALGLFGAGGNIYLTSAVANCAVYRDLPHHIYQDLLDVSHDDAQFEEFFAERKLLLSRLPENLPELSAYCNSVGRHGKNAVFYLTDGSEDEEYTFMQTVDHNDWTDDELTAAISHAFPELALYMKDFVFDRLNTRLTEKDAEFRQTLTEYFHRYKIQKVKNRIEEDFLQQVNQLAVDRPFNKLPSRSSIVKNMDKKSVQAYFFDALGVEYLGYIQAKCEEYGLIYEIDIGHCELPSITVKNKEFKHYFETKDIGDLDELKHHSQVYDYQTCEYPIHLFRELEIVDRELRRIRSQLIQNSSEKAVIVSDHGASRLAVIYKHENSSPLELEEKGQHSGRCCPSEKDPEIPQAAYEDGYAVLGNYERFRGSRKANLEVHGGAALEEVVVPVITLSLKPDNIVYYFVDPVIKFKISQAPTIELFSNTPMNQPILEVEGTFYDGVFQKDKKHAVFTLTELKKTREYAATVYEGNRNTGVVLSFRIERSTKTRDLFGLS